MMAYRDGKSFVFADIPGLIEGASEGVGARPSVPAARRALSRADSPGGLRRHGSRSARRLKDFDAINKELALHSPAGRASCRWWRATSLTSPMPRSTSPAFRAIAQAARGSIRSASRASPARGLDQMLDRVAALLFRRQPPCEADPARRPRQPGATPARRKTAPVGVRKKKRVTSSKDQEGPQARRRKRRLHPRRKRRNDGTKGRSRRAACSSGASERIDQVVAQRVSGITVVAGAGCTIPTTWRQSCGPPRGWDSRTCTWWKGPRAISD